MNRTNERCDLFGNRRERMDCRPDDIERRYQRHESCEHNIEHRYQLILSLIG